MGFRKTGGRQAFAYMDKDEAGPRSWRYESEMREFAKSHRLSLNRTIVDFDGRGAIQLVNLLDRFPRSVVLIPRRSHLLYLEYRDLTMRADAVVEVARP